MKIKSAFSEEIPAKLKGVKSAATDRDFFLLGLKASGATKWGPVVAMDPPINLNTIFLQYTEGMECICKFCLTTAEKLPGSLLSSKARTFSTPFF